MLILSYENKKSNDRYAGGAALLEKAAFFEVKPDRA